MFCCQVPLVNDISINSILSNIKPCSQHQEQTFFMCLEKKCQDKCLLCPNCISGKHKQHKWASFNDLLTPQIKQIILSGTSKLGSEVQLATIAMADNFKTFSIRIKTKLDLVQTQLDKQIQFITEKYPINGSFNFTGIRMDQQNAVILKNLVERQQNTAWILAMQEIISKTLSQAEESFNNILEDIHTLFANQKWDQYNNKQQEIIIDDFRDHLHPHFKPDPQYFRWEQYNKPIGITVDHQRLQATYFRQPPNKIGIYAVKPFTRQHNKVGFEIVKTTRTMIFFSSILICIGVCTPITVKNKNHRRLAQPFAGCYMIGNSGWCYHNKLAKYDRQDTVGFDFGKGDIITVQILFKNKGKLIFSKGGMFPKQFEMQLDLQQNQLKKLHPVLYFDGDVGSKVRLVNYAKQDSQESD